MEELARADLAGPTNVIPVVSEHRLFDPDAEQLRPLFAAALESGRAHGELLSTLLSASLALAGADLAAVCRLDGTLLGAAPESADAAAFAARAVRTLREGGPPGEELYLVQLALDPAALLAVRWARARRARPDIVQAIAAACARLLSPAYTERALPREAGRGALLRQLGDALAVAERAGTRVGVLSIGFEAFGGGAAADPATVAAVAELQGAIRRGDVLERIADDEMVAILAVVSDESELVEAATRFSERAARSHDAAGPAAPRIGIAVSPEDGTTAEALLRHAAQARNAAGDHAHPVRWYRDGVGRELIDRRALRARLHGADLERDFLLCYQPIVSAATMRVVGAEALVRWRHPSRGWLAPRSFLAAPVAPVLSPRLQGWVIEAIAQALRGWGAATDLRVHVNVHAGDDGARAELERAFAATGEAAARFAVETSAGAALADRDASTAFLRGLRERGVAIGLDGIGLAGTPLEALSLVPLDFVRLAPQVVQRAPSDPAAARVARAALGAARALDLRTVADGIESFEQARWWIANEVTELAGYYLGQPMTAPDFTDWLASAHLSLRKAQ